jgi:hypothetical protein
LKVGERPAKEIRTLRDISVHAGHVERDFGANMNAIASLFLRAKHWQIFLLFAIFYVGGGVIMIFTTMTTQSPDNFGKIGLPLAGVMVLNMLCLLGWLWSMGTFLNSILPPMLRMKMGFFRFALAYPAVYLPVFMLIFQSATRNPGILAIMFPLHLFATFCMFYLLYFVSKSLVLAETGKPVSFHQYAGPFFLLWFFPVGVWITQPRINRLYAERRNAEPYTGVAGN